MFGSLSFCNNGANARWQWWKLHSVSLFWLRISDLCNYKSLMHLQGVFFKHQRVSREIRANTNSSVLISIPRPILVHWWSEKCVAKGFKYAHWIGLYLRFLLSLVLGSFVHGSRQNLQTNEGTFRHVLTPLINISIYVMGQIFELDNHHTATLTWPLFFRFATRPAAV